MLRLILFHNKPASTTSPQHSTSPHLGIDGNMCPLPPPGNQQALGGSLHSGSLLAVPSPMVIHMNTHARGSRSSGGVSGRGMMTGGNRGAQRMQKGAEDQLSLIKKQLLRLKAPQNPNPPHQPPDGLAPAHGLSVSAGGGMGNTRAAAPHVLVSMPASGSRPGHSPSVGGNANPRATGQRSELRSPEGGRQVRKDSCAGCRSASSTGMCE